MGHWVIDAAWCEDKERRDPPTNCKNNDDERWWDEVQLWASSRLRVDEIIISLQQDARRI
jgi:hypothetical protein